jgi:hypothetical protein
MLPTHNNVIFFVDQFWPEIHLVPPGNSLSESSLREDVWNVVLGFTPYGMQGAVLYPTVAIIMLLIEQWLQGISTLTCYIDQLP